MGRVVDERGVGIENARVTVLGIPYEVLSHPDGSFLFSKVPPGDYVVTARAATAYVDPKDTVRVERGQVTTLILKEVTVRMMDRMTVYRHKLPAGMGTIVGTVVDEEGHEANYSNVFILNTSYGMNTGPAGRYSVVVPVGTYAVQVRRVGCNTLTRDSVQVSEGQTTTVDFKLKEQPGLR